MAPVQRKALQLRAWSGSLLKTRLLFLGAEGSVQQRQTTVAVGPSCAHGDLQERAALQRDLAAVEAALSAAQLSVDRWKRSVAHQAVQLHSAQEDLEQSQLQVQLLRLEGEAQTRRFASLMQGKAALCTELQQQLALGCQREVGLKVSSSWSAAGVFSQGLACALSPSLEKGCAAGRLACGTDCGSI